MRGEAGPLLGRGAPSGSGRVTPTQTPSGPRTSPTRNDPNRAFEAQRAAEVMLGSSASSLTSQASVGPPGSHQSIEEQPNMGWPPGPPSYSYYYSSQPPSYHSYYHQPVYQGSPFQSTHQPPPAVPRPPALTLGPQPFHHLPPHLSHLQYSSTGGGYNSHSFPVIMTDDLVAGTQHRGKMSPVRRFYILLLTFDLLFTCLLWIISILVTGRDLNRELHHQVLEYTIHSSMFDCVVAAAGRFLLGLLVYGLLDISHWWAITVTTTCTVVFLIAKVFQYQWHSQPITYDVMLVLLSFILAWGEAWFFDFRMIPLETKAKEIWGQQPQREIEDDERRPLLGGIGGGGGHGGMLERFVEGSTLYEGSVGNFYSPFESPANSDVEDDEETVVVHSSPVIVPKAFRRRTNHPLSQQEKDYKKQGEEVLAAAWNTLNSPDWKLEKKLDNGDMVQVKQVGGKRVFRLTGYVDLAPRKLLEELFYGIEGVPSWNPTLVECKTVQPIDMYTDISYQVCAEAGGGVVSTRDFVNLRHWSVIEGVYVSAGASVTHPAMPPVRGRVRGENGPGCWAMRPVEGKEGTTLFQWLLDTDIKGWIPQSIIDKALSGTQFEYIANIRSRAQVIKDSNDLLNSSLASCTDLANS